MPLEVGMFVSSGRSLRREAFLLGDSITQYGFSTEEECQPGWASILAHRFSRKVDIINRGYSGYNTRKILAILPILLGESRRERLAFATLFLGANDGAPPSEDGPTCQHVPLSEYEENLTQIAKQLQAVAETVVIISPPACDESKDLGGRTLDITRAYGAAAGRVAKSLGLPFLDTMTRMEAAGEAQWKMMLCDGLHLASKGNRFIAEALLEKLKSEAGIDPDLLPWDLPLWRDLDRDAPATSLTEVALKTLEAPGVRNAIDVELPMCSLGEVGTEPHQKKFRKIAVDN